MLATVDSFSDERGEKDETRDVWKEWASTWEGKKKGEIDRPVIIDQCNGNFRRKKLVDLQLGKHLYFIFLRR